MFISFMVGGVFGGVVVAVLLHRVYSHDFMSAQLANDDVLAGSSEGFCTTISHLSFNLLQLLSSNRVDDAKEILRKETWWNLEQAWEGNLARDGEFSNDFDPVFRSVYPQIRSQVDLSLFRYYPSPMLARMTNFMKSGDGLRDK